MMVPDLYLEHLYMKKHGLKLRTCLRHMHKLSHSENIVSAISVKTVVVLISAL